MAQGAAIAIERDGVYCLGSVVCLVNSDREDALIKYEQFGKATYARKNPANVLRANAGCIYCTGGAIAKLK